MGSVEKRQLSVAGAFLSTMRVTGQALSVGILGSLSAARLGVAGWTLLLSRAGGPQVAGAFAWGYRNAMLAGAGLALLGMGAAFTRGAHQG
jgi:hypothetical protein